MSKSTMKRIRTHLGMTGERVAFLMNNPDEQLTQEEIDKGWFFCCEWDGLLINRRDKEAEACTCNQVSFIGP